MIYDFLRFSIDTLYLGFRFTETHYDYIYPEIINFLSDVLFIKLDEYKKGNLYYWKVLCSEEDGVNIQSEPRENLKNDLITLQLSGKFFRDIEGSNLLLDFLFKKYSEYIIIQRIDVACDICFEKYPSFWQCNDDFPAGFPVPSYSLEYKYKQIPFLTYGRMSKFGRSYNMVSQGKGDTHLRVYDKTLDIMEKYNELYSVYYSLSKDFEQVYRIEFQARGKRLKGFIQSYIEHYKTFSKDTLIDSFLQYIFQKYRFQNIDSNEIIGEFRKPFRFVEIKRISTLEDRIKWHTGRQNSEYQKIVDLYDKLQAQRALSTACQKVISDDKKFGFSKEFIDMYKVYKENFLLNGNKECSDD